METFKFGEIDLTGLKSVGKHALAVMFVALLMYGISLAGAHDFGPFQALVTIVIGTAGAFVKKFAETYSVAIPNIPVVTNDETGSVTPKDDMTA